MHGLMGIWRMDPTRRAEQLAGLEAMVIPQVRRQPGFIAGYWTHDDSTHTSYSLVLFDTEEQARACRRLPEEAAERSRAVGIEAQLLTVVSVDGYDVADASVLRR
jgi:heme-degrading monooxygenase HmoA